MGDGDEDEDDAGGGGERVVDALSPLPAPAPSLSSRRHAMVSSLSLGGSKIPCVTLCNKTYSFIRGERVFLLLVPVTFP